MKRFLICALAAVGMVACVSEDVVQLPKSEAISFADAFIGNSTRAVTAEDPSTTKAKLKAFDVWAYMTSTDGIVLEGENLTLTEKGSWYYFNTQYWTPKRNYFFAALAPMDSANWNLDTSKAVFDGGAGLVTFENIDGSEDLIYATASATTPDRETLVDEGMPAVKFQFEHLLSKVKFTFHNGFKTDNARLVIENVKMTAPKKGEINLSDVDYKWTLDNDEFTLDFGNVGTLSTKDNVAKLECDYERLTIPADETYTYNIEFDVTLYYGEEVAYEVTKSSAVTGVALEKGHAYNFYTEINPQNLELHEIVFEVEGVDTWIPENGEDVQIALAELKAAAMYGGTYTLCEDIDVTDTINVYGDLTLNLNGHKLYNSTDLWSTTDFALLSVEGGKLTIEGEGTVEAKENDCYALYVTNGGELTINGGTIIGNIHAVYVSNDGGVANLNGGYYDIKQKYSAADPYRMLLNCGDTGYRNGISKIVVTGGEYVGFNPENNAAEGANTNFCAEGYAAYSAGANYKIANVGAYDVAVANATDLTAALNGSAVSTILLAEGEFGVIVAKSNKTIVAVPTAKVDAVVFNGSENVTLKNIVFDAATAVMGYDGKGNAKRYANIVNDNNAGSNTPTKGASDIVIDGCTFTGTFANGGVAIALTDQSRSGGFTGNVTIKNCIFDTVGASYDVYGYYCGNGQNGKGNFVIENNTFNTVHTAGLPVYLGRYASSTPVVVKGNAFNTVSTLANAVYVQAHSGSYNVSIDASNNTFAN